MTYEIDFVRSNLKDWVAEGRAGEATHIIVVFDLLTKKYYPHYVLNNNLDSDWDAILQKPNQKPMISFNLNKKVLGVDV